MAGGGVLFNYSTAHFKPFLGSSSWRPVFGIRNYVLPCAEWVYLSYNDSSHSCIDKANTGASQGIFEKNTRNTYLSAGADLPI